MVVLATGLVAPRAYAVVNPDVAAEVLHILALLTNNTYGLKAIHNQITAGVNQTSIKNLQTSVNGIPAQTFGSKILSVSMANIGVNAKGNETLASAVSDHAYLWCYVFINTRSTLDTVNVYEGPTVEQYKVPGNDTISGCQGEPAGQSVTYDSDDDVGVIQGRITLITSADANASLTTPVDSGT